MRLITNHAPIGEYCHCFFPYKKNACPEMNVCPCGEAKLETCFSMIAPDTMG